MRKWRFLCFASPLAIAACAPLEPVEPIEAETCDDTATPDCAPETEIEVID